MNVWRKFVQHIVPMAGNAYRPRILERQWLIFFLTIVLASEGVFVAGLIAQQTQEQMLGAVVPAEVVALTNDQRAQNNVGVLHENSLLDAAAQAKASDMAQRGYFSHVSPDGTEPWAWITAAGYEYQSAGENLAVRFDTSSEVVNAWMASPSHRANIIKPVYTEIGVGTAQGMYQGIEVTFVVQYFGAPLFATAKASTSTTSRVAVHTTVASTTATKPSSTSRVAGAETATAATAPVPATPVTSATMSVRPLPPVEHVSDSVARQTMRALSETPKTTYYILGGVASLLLLLIALAFFVHIHIQPVEMLLGGALVAGIAISFLTLNSYVPQLSATQTASVFSVHEGVILEGESTTTSVTP